MSEEKTRGTLERAFDNANAAGVIHPELVDELRDHARKMDAYHRKTGANEDRKLLAGVIDGVAPPDPEPTQIGDDPESVLNYGTHKPLPPIEREPWFVEALTGLPRAEVVDYLEKHPDTSPPLHAPVVNNDPPVLWQAPVQAVFTGPDSRLAGVGDFREHLAGTLVKLTEDDRVLYWHDHRSGVYVVKEGDWERAPDQVVQYCAWLVESQDAARFAPTVVSIEDRDAAELRITDFARAQVSPILRKAGYAPVQGA